MNSKREFIEDYIDSLEAQILSYKSISLDQRKSAESDLFDLILEIRNVFAKELPDIENAILIREGTAIRDANSVVGILKLHLINIDNEKQISKIESADADIHIPSNKVFIVHGHDNEAKLEVAHFIEKAGMEAIILHEQPNNGKTIIEKIESFTDVDFAVVLYTYCDDGKDKLKNEFNKRARQNVVFEHGYLISKLSRSRVCALLKGNIETPGDISGVVFTTMDEAGAWKADLVKDMRSAGCAIDMNKIS
ncbi:MAG: nucleotide-binding protein [Anaerovoracaceae bacterium]